MRTVLVLAAASVMTVPAAAGLPPAGLYCAVSRERPPIVIGPEPGGVGIDSLDCQDATVASGRLTATRCFANGGTVVPYYTSFNVIDTGEIVHEMEIYRRVEQAPCD